MFVVLAKGRDQRVRLDDRNAGCLGALGSLTDLELNALVLIEGLEATGLDLGVVNENVAIRVIRGDEAETLFGVEPLDGSQCHVYLLILELQSDTPRTGFVTPREDLNTEQAEA
ncbi:hypothetical protein ARTHRO9V_100223 [Arthrobacter sp. 9V]|nr:hypothetical protein ARTHRO9V_100223 [Arthrobacter sp. 9V]